MKTQWDYTDLAKAYLKRPDYAPKALEGLFELIQLPKEASVCDVGAGVAHLTLPLLRQGFRVTAVEPNDAMRVLGRKRTQDFENIMWFEGTGEVTGQPEHCFDLVSFGSSFNVCEREKALQETKRILKPGGWFTCLWNHRNLDDPIQQEIETLIQKHVPDYHYGTRREDQRSLLEHSGYFKQIYFFSGQIVHQMSRPDMVMAWRSHATLQRQAANRFEDVIADIDGYLNQLESQTVEIPYTTRLWAAQLRS